jgi:peroxiredoxin/outer membrane lipoprotein-sorting protein
MRIVFSIATLILLSSSVDALTPTSTTAPEIFESIIAKSSSRSTRFSFEQSTQMMGMTINGSGKGTYDLPRSRTDLTFETPIGNIAVRTISDGETLWQIEETPMGKKAIRHDISKPLDGGMSPVDPFMAFAGVNTREFLDGILKTFDARVQGIDASEEPSVYVLNLAPRMGERVPTLEFRIGVEDAFPREMNIFSPDGEPITSMKVTQLDFGIQAAPSTFAYTPDSDTQVIDASDLVERNIQRPDSRPNLEGASAPDFQLTALDGRQVALSSFRGQHVLIDFWATWCPPCKKALPHIQALSEGTTGLVVLTVNAEPASVARPFLDKYGYSFTTLVDADRSVSANYGVSAIPTTFIIAPDGTVAKQMIGYHTAEQLREALVTSGLSL